MFSILKRPYPALFTLKRNLIVAISVALVSMILNYYRLNDEFFNQNTIIPHLFISLISGIIIGLSLMLIIHIIPNFIISAETKENWTIGKELLISIGVFVTIFVFNYIFFIIIVIDNSRLLSLPFFLKIGSRVITTGTAIFASVLWVNYIIILKRNIKNVSMQNKILTEKLNKHIQQKNNQLVRLESSLINEIIEFNINDLLFIKSEGNYIEVYTKTNGKVKKNLYRASLQMVDDRLNEFSFIIRTHRSYLVNINNILKTEGNARNYQIFFDETDTFVPVSRNRFAIFNSAFQ